MAKDAGAVIARYGEVFLKRGRKGYFLDCLARNIQLALNRHHPELKLKRPYGRFLVVPLDPEARIEDPEAVSRTVASVFGIVWAGPAELVADPTLESVEAAVVEYARVHRRRKHRSFRIATTRANKAFPANSMECNRRFGSAVFLDHGDLEVDLKDPDFTIGVEIRGNQTFVYGAGVPGVRGLPVGSNGRALLLLSGGIDSPVAGWLVQKRGVAVDAITFLSPPYTGPQARQKVETLARKLREKQGKMRLWVVPLTPIQEHYRDQAPPKLLVLLYRRSMFRIASELARRHNLEGLVTGENLGQVASQTLPNLHVIASAADRAVLRPLLTYDKVEIIRLAREIDTYETSILPYEDCCSLFVPAHPELKGRVGFLEHIEEQVQPGPLEEAALAAAECIEIEA